MSFPFKILFKKYWKYHFDGVLSRFHLLIDIASDLVQVNFLKHLFKNFSFFFYDNMIAKCSFLLILTKYVLQKCVKFCSQQGKIIFHFS